LTKVGKLERDLAILFVVFVGKKINFILVYVARNWHCFIVGRGDWFLYDDDNNNNKIKR
jgi:hypothetical protein